MPSGLIPDEGLSVPIMRILQPTLANTASWRLILWKNNFTPDHLTVRANLVDATFPGYSFVTMNPALWQPPTVTPRCVQSQYGTTALSWNVTAATTETMYGWAMIDVGANVIRYVQRFEAADLHALASGEQFTLLPLYTLCSAACPGLGVRQFKRPYSKPGVELNA